MQPQSPKIACSARNRPGGESARGRARRPARLRPGRSWRLAFARVVAYASAGLIAVLLAGPTALAADDPDDGADLPLAGARKAIANGQWQSAIDALEPLAAGKDDADVFNLLGYSHRKLGRVDQALENYRRALAIEPRHRGANEYLGELHLELGDLAAAETRLEVLRRACRGRCEEYSDLRAAVDAYRARAPAPAAGGAGSTGG